MGLQRIKIFFDGRWDQGFVYTDFRVLDVNVPSDSSFQQLVQHLQGKLLPHNNLSISCLSIYRDGSKNSNLIQIVDDKDVIWLMSLLTTSPHSSIGVVVDYESPGDSKNTVYFNHDLPGSKVSTQSSDSNFKILDFQDIESDISHVSIEEGSYFKSKSVLKKAVYLIALKNSVELSTNRSNYIALDIRCKDLSCRWYLRASIYKKTGVWIVRKLIDSHQCAVDIVKDGHRQTTSWIVAECTKSFFKMNEKVPCRPLDVINYMKMNYGENVSYDKVWRGREIALNSIRGTPESSYALLSSFSAALIEKNPGTYTAQESDDQGRFRYYFMAFASSTDAWKFCLPIMSVDGASLKNKFMGTLISACAIDGNSQIVPLAFVIVDSENDRSWSWFFCNLKAAFGEHPELVIVSNGHKSIANESSVYESAEQGLCAFHLYKNLLKNYNISLIKDTFHNCARAYTNVEFEHYMRQLDDIHPSIRIELEDLGKSKWARAFCRRKLYSLMTTNISESMNSYLKEARELPIIGLLESIRSLVQRWFYERRTHWNFQRTELSTFAEGMIRSSLKESRSMNIYPINQYEFEVDDLTKQFFVNISNRSCSCKMWDLDLIPCSHACTALSYKNLDIQSFTHSFYSVSNLAQLYRKETRPIGNVQQFSNTHLVGDDPVMPPCVKRPANRPKKKMILSCLENKGIVRCSRCGKRGHNSRSCKEELRN